MEGRKYTRFSVQLPVSCHGDNFFERGTILNVSAEGCAITSDIVPSAGVYLHVTMQLREQEEPVQIDLAAVRWVSAARFGIEFIRVRPEEGERLKEFVKRLESTA